MYIRILNINMSSQIFKQPVPIDHLYKLLDQICLKTNKYYVIDMNAFRKMQFTQLPGLQAHLFL